jgi:hypothetical protein
VPVAEVVVVHCGDDEATSALTQEACWRDAGLSVRYFHYPERNCAAQRNFAASHATYDNLLLVDDDVEVEARWAEELFKPIWHDPNVAATMGRLINQPMATPTFFWRVYRTVLHGKTKGFEPGRLVGAALPNGFPTTARELIPCEWIGGGASALRREAFEAVGVLRRSLQAARPVRISILVIDSAGSGRSITSRRRSVSIIRQPAAVRVPIGTSIFRCDRGLGY